MANQGERRGETIYCAILMGTYNWGGAIKELNAKKSID